VTPKSLRICKRILNNEERRKTLAREAREEE